MIKDGKLMRLAESAFDEVMKPPAVDWLTPGMASIMARRARSSRRAHARGVRAALDQGCAINTPLYTLRETVRNSTRPKKYIVYCNTGERSAGRCFILGKLGFEVYALQGGYLGHDPADGEEALTARDHRKDKD
jgi:rhodanese-related sulfurtransferase